MNNKIIFHENQLCERGTSVALYDYAYYGKRFLNLEPIIVYNSTNNSDEQAIKKFKDEFNIFSYENFNEVNTFIEKNDVKYFYALKYGYNDGILSSTKNLIHSVFSKGLEDVHGDRYAVISEWQSLMSNNKIPSVPHMLNQYETEEDLRHKLSIPKDAIVIGRHGGYETFNIDFVIESIHSVLEKRSDIWFLFMNTEKKINHDRCIYLDKTSSLKEKSMFVNTCDHMIHARDYGETFGLSVLEFAAKNKTIISYDNEILQSHHPLGGRNHFLFLEDKCYKYSCKEQLDQIFSNITKDVIFDTSFLSEKFSPLNVIKQFEKIFLNE